MLTKNQFAEVEVVDMNNLGYGVARIDGFVVFLDGGVTGDRLKIKIIKVAKDYAVGRIEEILSPSAVRRQSDCEVSKRCGGCSFRSVSREYELALKREFVRSAFRKNRVAAEVQEVLTDGVVDGYRNKVQYPMAPDGSFGYYARHSHELVKCRDCRLADPAFTPVAHYVSEYIARTGASVKHLYLRRGQKTGQMMLCLVSGKDALPDERNFVQGARERFPELRSILLNIHPEQTNVILGKRVKVLYGEDFIEDELCGCRFGISSLSFYQVNRGAAELLYREAIRRGAQDSPSAVADLYCGAGTIGLSFAKAHPGTKVTGVEIIPDAVRNAKRNAEKNSIANAEFLCADAMTAPLAGYDCIMIDPPRKGMSPELVKRLCTVLPHRIVYVSCEPGTLARDAALLIAAGYRMSSVTPVDMFPRTGAVECVTDFVRENPKG